MFAKLNHIVSENNIIIIGKNSINKPLKKSSLKIKIANKGIKAIFRVVRSGKNVIDGEAKPLLMKAK